MKVLVIGIDGASPQLIDKWIDELPTFQKIKMNGHLGLSIPPTPAQTPVAWTTFMTGKNPGKHGIFSFMMRKKGTYERQVAQPTMIKSKTLWQLLSEEGKEVGIVNVPMSDVQQFNGFIIPGFLSRTEGIPHPEKIRNKIEQKFRINTLTGDVETEILQNIDKDPDTFFERVNEITDETARISQYLVKEEQWDFLMTVFMGADRIQHFFWKYVDTSHQKYETNKFTLMVKAFYVKLDRIIQDFLKLIDEETITIVISDHGFCPVNKELVINNYLEELGFLKAKNGKINPEKSKAISYGYGDIWLNVKDREPHGKIKLGQDYENIRQEIAQGLHNIRIYGERPFKDIKKREEIYWGSELNNGPDLMAIFNIGWQAARHPEILDKKQTKNFVNDNPRWSGGHDGTHDSTDVPGIFGLIGKNVEYSKRPSVNLWDVAPTILNLMSIHIPPDMDGKPLEMRKC